MKIDSYGCMIMEEVEDPGNVGDSCAETSRFAILCGFVDYDGSLLKKIRLSSFTSDTGFLRHPNAPDGPPRSKDSWRESDASSDQVLPLRMAASIGERTWLASMIDLRIQKDHKVNPTTYAAPALIALCYGFLNVFQLMMVIQALIFKIPFRWDDSVGGFRSSKGSSADYLNFFISMAFLHLTKHRWGNSVVKKLVAKETIIEMIRHYYRYEPNSSWLIEMYEHAIGEVYK